MAIIFKLRLLAAIGHSNKELKSRPRSFIRNLLHALSVSTVRGHGGHSADIQTGESTQFVPFLHCDLWPIALQCREIGYETHEEILRVLHELHTTMKTYHSYQAELRQAESKLQTAENQRSKLEQSLPQDKLDRSKKYKLMEKEVQKVISRRTRN